MRNQRDEHLDLAAHFQIRSIFIRHIYHGVQVESLQCRECNDWFERRYLLCRDAEERLQVHAPRRTPRPCWHRLHPTKKCIFAVNNNSFRSQTCIFEVKRYYQICQTFPDFGGLVLDRLEADFCEKHYTYSFCSTIEVL